MQIEVMETYQQYKPNGYSINTVSPALLVIPQGIEWAREDPKKHPLLQVEIF